MKKKSENIGNNFLFILSFLVLTLFVEIIVRIKEIPSFILPSPSTVVKNLWETRVLLWEHSLVTILEALAGFIISIILAFIIGALIYNKKRIKAIIYPFLLISQTVPLIAIAPLILIWFGFGIMPKIIIVIIVCIFPILVSFLDGLSATDKELIELFTVMKAPKIKIFFTCILPNSLSSFLAGCKIAATYAIMGAVIGEWLGAEKGLGIYMTRTLSSFQTEGLFASIVIVILLSIILFKIMEGIEYLAMPWKRRK